MKATITFTRFYAKTETVDVPMNQFKGMTEEEIGDVLTNQYNSEPSNLEFPNGFEEITSNVTQDIAEDMGRDTDRFDIYNDAGESIYGGHL